MPKGAGIGRFSNGRGEHLPVKLCVGLAKRLGMRTVLEGIETARDLALARAAVNASAAGANAVALGVSTTAAGRGAAASVGEAVAQSSNTTAISYKATAIATNAMAVGANARAIGSDATAIGTGAVASGATSVALGSGSVASEADTVSVGSSGSERRITNVAAGVNPTDAVNVSQLRGVQQIVNDVARMAYAGVAMAGALIGRSAAGRTRQVVHDGRRYRHLRWLHRAGYRRRHAVHAERHREDGLQYNDEWQPYDVQRWLRIFLVARTDVGLHNLAVARL